MKIKFIFLLLFFVVSLSFSQDKGTDHWWQLSPEIRVNTNKFEFRYRPYETFILSNTESGSKTTFGRTDFMAGFLHKKFKFFVYSKFETRKKSFIGPRIDFSTRVFNNRILLHGQYRYFWGLNEKSKDHQYLITLIEYDTKQFFNFGVLGYNKQTFEGSTIIFYGPVVSFSLTKNVSFMVSYLKDFNIRSRYFTFVRMNIKFKTQKVKK